MPRGERRPPSPRAALRVQDSLLLQLRCARFRMRFDSPDEIQNRVLPSMRDEICRRLVRGRTDEFSKAALITRRSRLHDPKTRVIEIYHVIPDAHTTACCPRFSVRLQDAALIHMFDDDVFNAFYQLFIKRDLKYSKKLFKNAFDRSECPKGCYQLLCSIYIQLYIEQAIQS